MDDKEYLLREVREQFAEKRRELSGWGTNTEALTRQLGQINSRWIKYQRAYEADAISVADLAARRVELESEREQIELALERARNCKAELEKLAEAERSISERIRDGYGDLDDQRPEERRKIYQNLQVRVEVGADKRPSIWGIFRPRRLPRTEGSDGQHTIYTVRAGVSSLKSSSSWTTYIIRGR